MPGATQAAPPAPHGDAAAIRAAPPAPHPPLRAATEADLADVRALLARAGLPLDGIEACVTERSALVCRAEDGALLGFAATERYGPVALLRSVAVAAPARGRGLGRALVGRALADAREAGAAEAWLLTETAEPFFAGGGWSRADRAAAPAAIAASVEFVSACPTTAVAMRRRL